MCSQLLFEIILSIKHVFTFRSEVSTRGMQLWNVLHIVIIKTYLFLFLGIDSGIDLFSLLLTSTEAMGGRWILWETTLIALSLGKK